MDKERIYRGQKIYEMTQGDGFALLAGEISERKDIAIRYLHGEYGFIAGEQLARWQASYKALSEIELWISDEIEKGKTALKDLQTTQQGSVQ